MADMKAPMPAEGADRRRSHRVNIAMPILVRGTRGAQRFEEAISDGVRQRAWLQFAFDHSRGSRSRNCPGKQKDGRGTTLHGHFYRAKRCRQARSRCGIHRAIATLLAHCLPAGRLGSL